MADLSKPDPSNMEPAEGSRETVNANLDEDHGEQDRFRQTNTHPAGQKAGGITNRPLDEEIEEQRELPERGASKQEDR